MPIFHAKDRDELRDSLIAHLRTDDRITGIALTGSVTRGGEDRWSDIDVAVGVSGGASVAVLSDLTRFVEETFNGFRLLDVPVRATVYRVFLLPGALQLDIAVSPEEEFGASAPTFRLLYGNSVVTSRPTPPPIGDQIGLATLQLIHARKTIERGLVMQGEYWLSELRREVVSMWCKYLDLAYSEARGADELPPERIAFFQRAMPRSLDPDELTRALTVIAQSFFEVVAALDPILAEQLDAASLRSMADPSSPIN